MKVRKASFIILTLLCAVHFGGSAGADLIDIYLVEPGVLNASSFFVTHEEGAHERVDNLDGSFNPFIFSPCVDLSSSPYPYDTPLSNDKRNQRSTLPIYISAVLRGISSSDGSFLYFEKTGYEHRNLTIQEVNPLDPEDPNNPNPIYDIDDIIQNDGGILPVGTFQEGVERMFRVGVYTILRGDMDEDGQIGLNDLMFLSGEWLNDTYIDDEYVGTDYNISDRNHDGLTNLLDFTIIAVDWLKEE